MLNAMTVDVEDYFQVSAFDDIVPRDRWTSYESRVCQNTQRLLDIFDEAGVRATFFILGWVAERHPGLVRQIAKAGHELASHSFEHRLVYDLTPDAFVADLRRARSAIGEACGHEVRGFRAPSYSITERSLWAIDLLISEGYEYDSSIYPIRHDRYGIPHWSREIQWVSRPHGGLWELPGSTVRRARMNLPIGGGGYFRLLPYGWTRGGIRRLNDEEQRPAIFYLHPWEIDPDQPRVPAGPLARYRHYANLHKTEDRLRRLLAEFRFGTISEVLSQVTVASGQAASAALPGAMTVPAAGDAGGRRQMV